MLSSIPCQNLWIHFLAGCCISFFSFTLSLSFWLSVPEIASRIMEGGGSNKDEPNRKLRIASRLFAYSERKMKITDAMKVAGYKTTERKAGTVYQPVRRAGEALQRSRTDPPPAMVLIGNSQNDSSISSLSISNIVVNSSSSEATPQSIAP